MLFIIDVLKYILESGPGTCFDVSDKFNITVHDASMRLFTLKKSGLVKKHTTIRPFEFIITEYGKRYIEYKKNNPEPTMWKGRPLGTNNNT